MPVAAAVRQAGFETDTLGGRDGGNITVSLSGASDGQS